MDLYRSVLLSLLFLVVARFVQADETIIECPLFVDIQPVAPAGWNGFSGYDKAPFALASIGSGQVLCYYGIKVANPPHQRTLHTMALIQRSVPAGMQCVVNRTDSRRVNCVPQSTGSPQQQIINK
jgi:hypothetical protein